MSYLLDTCVISELVKKSPRRQVVDWIDGHEESTLFLSVLTIGELGKGIVKLSASARKTRLTTWVRRDLPVIDSLIATTALVHDLQVVTRNTEDFVRCGVVCINPWDK